LVFDLLLGQQQCGIPAREEVFEGVALDPKLSVKPSVQPSSEKMRQSPGRSTATENYATARMGESS
jgi:hypothetical protein